MKPIYFKLDSGRALVVVPEIQVILDGHPVLSLNYNVFANEDNVDQHGFLSTTEQSPQKTDVNYLGFITFEQPGKMYSYTSENDNPLSRSEVEETIELISHVRDNPDLWKNSLN